MKVYCYNIKQNGLSNVKFTTRLINGNLDSTFEAEPTDEYPSLYQSPIIGDVVEIGKLRVKLIKKI